MAKLFMRSRYVTRGIADKISLELQMLLWTLIDVKKRKGQELDYLQIFELSVECLGGESYQKITHSQEVPPFTNQHIFHLTSQPVIGSVWVIDSTEYATMLLPEEY